MFGYCFGGILSVLYAAGHSRRSDPLAVRDGDTDRLLPMGTFGSVLHEGRVDPEDLLDATGNVPAEVIRNGFRMAKPIVNVTEYVNLWQHLWDDDYLDAHRVMSGWARDHIPFPGAAFVQTTELFTRGNALATGKVAAARRRGRSGGHRRTVQQHHRRQRLDRPAGSLDAAHRPRRYG